MHWHVLHISCRWKSWHIDIYVTFPVTKMTHKQHLFNISCHKWTWWQHLFNISCNQKVDSLTSFIFYFMFLVTGKLVHWQQTFTSFLSAENGHLWNIYLTFAVTRKRTLWQQGQGPLWVTSWHHWQWVPGVPSSCRTLSSRMKWRTLTVNASQNEWCTRRAQVMWLWICNSW